MFILGALLLATPVFAADAGRVIEVGVKGMVCSFCAQGLTKQFGEEPAVEKADVSLKKKMIRLTLKENQSISDERIKAIVTDSGYELFGINRKPK